MLRMMIRGAVIGAIIASLAQFRESGHVPPHWGLFVATGALLSTILWFLRTFRATGRKADYASWTVATTIAFVVIGLPELIESGVSAIGFAALVALGAVAGIGLCAHARTLAGKGW